MIAVVSSRRVKRRAGERLSWLSAVRSYVMRKWLSATSVTAGGIIAAFVAFGVILYATDALVFTGTDPSSKVVSASLALIAAFLAAVVTLVGILLKHTIDRHAEIRLVIESQRNELMAREAEDRLKLEASIRAIQLLGTAAGTPTLPTQRAGALMTLSSLGQHSLAIGLTAELLERGEIDARAATHVLDGALRTDDSSIQADAVYILISQVGKFLTATGYELPAAIMRSPSEQPAHVRRWLPDIVAGILLARPITEWQQPQFRTCPNGLLAILGLAWQHETDSVAKRDLGVIIREVVPLFSLTFLGRLTIFSGEINILQIHADAKSERPATDTVVRLVDRIREWGARK